VAESLCLQNYFLPSLTQLLFVSPDFWCVRKRFVCVQMLCTLSVIFGHSFISIGNWSKYALSACTMKLGSWGGIKGLVCLPDLFLHHSQGPDSSCFCTVHVASLLQQHNYAKILLSQKSPYSDKPLQLLPPFVQMSVIFLYFLHYTLQKTDESWWKRETETPPAANN